MQERCPDILRRQEGTNNDCRAEVGYLKAQSAEAVHIVTAGEAAINREGIKDDGTADYENCVIDYAAYLFRKRAGTETAMPRFLRWELNNILVSQKAKEAKVSE